jgi:hypothetical protein
MIQMPPRPLQPCVTGNYLRISCVCVCVLCIAALQNLSMHDPDLASMRCCTKAYIHTWLVTHSFCTLARQGSRVRLLLLRNGDTLEVTLERSKDGPAPPYASTGSFPANAAPTHSTVPLPSVFPQNASHVMDPNGNFNMMGSHETRDDDHIHGASAGQTTAARKEIEAQMAEELK